jgi:hypothetical protein
VFAHPILNIYPNLETAEVETSNMTDHISVSGPLKLVTPFKGDKRDVLAFVVNADMAFKLDTQGVRIH